MAGGIITVQLFERLPNSFPEPLNHFTVMPAGTTVQNGLNLREAKSRHFYPILLNLKSFDTNQ